MPGEDRNRNQKMSDLNHDETGGGDGGGGGDDDDDDDDGDDGDDDDDGLLSCTQSLMQPFSLNLPTAAQPRAVVGIYFSAKWCAPCRSFTPKLKALFHRLNENEAEGVASLRRRLMFVFVSADRTLTQYNEYRKQMPWYVIPIQLLCAKLSQSVQCCSAPMLCRIRKSL
jgi:thiol-disulfide isomerase/thioredoxin